MANLKSSKKDIKRTEKRRVKNQAAKSAIKTYIKKVRVAATAEDAQKALVVAQGALDKAVQHGVIHKNQAARRMSRAAKAAKAK
ncbi:MAG: 30S ribosomal protein S20 [Fimbriimonadaceae bacterium]